MRLHRPDGPVDLAMAVKLTPPSSVAKALKPKQRDQKDRDHRERERSLHRGADEESDPRRRPHLCGATEVSAPSQLAEHSADSIAIGLRGRQAGAVFAHENVDVVGVAIAS